MNCAETKSKINSILITTDKENISYSTILEMNYFQESENQTLRIIRKQ